MNKIQKKILSDLVFHPGVILPVVSGFTSWMISWATSGNAILNFIGLVGILGGCGLLLTKFVYNLEDLAVEAQNLLEIEKETDKNQQLDELDVKLASNRDPRDQEALRTLREIYITFKKQTQEKNTLTSNTIFNTVQEIFDTCIQQLEKSYELLETSKKTKNNILLNQRDKLIDEVLDAIEYLQKIIEKFNEKETEKQTNNLTELRQELDSTMRAARRAEEIVSGKKSYNVSEFE